MKKHLGNLFIVITSFIFVIVLFGCLSINSKAATKLQPAKDVKFVDDHYHYRAASTGYYTVLMSRKTTNYTSWYLLETNRSRDKGDIVNNEISRIYPYSKGKVTLYVICHPTLKDYETKDGIEPYERDKTCKIAKSKVANVTKQMSMVTDLQVKPATDDAHKNMYRVSWNPDGAAHKVFIRTSYGGGASIVGRETNCVYVNMTSYDREIQIMTLSTNLATTADSEVKSIYAPAVDPNILYNIGAFTIDLRNGPVTLTDPVCLEALGGILSSTRFEVVEDGTKQGESYYVVYVDLDKDGSMDVSFYEGTDFSTVTLLPTNSIKDQLTLTIDEAGLKWAIKSEYKYYSQLTVLVPKAPEPSYSDPGTIPTIDGKPVDAGSISQVITVDGITYIIDVNNKATAVKIASKKKASLNRVTANGTTYQVVAIADAACKNNKKITTVTIGSNVTSIGKDAFRGCKKLKKVTINANKSLKIGKGAFKKIGKKATIKVKGIKGKARKKLIKSIM